MIIYTGIFFNQNFETKLAKGIALPHVTHKFKPNLVDRSLFGQNVTFEVYGYGKSKDNEGYLVKPISCSTKMLKALKEIKIPHLTIGVSENGKPVNTKDLKFVACEPFLITGTYGAFTKKGLTFSRA